MDYWNHQQEKPLFPDVIWSKPETSQGAGKLLIVGGSAGSFALTARAFAEAEQAGVGTTFVVVPDSLSKITKAVPYISYAASNPSGGFSREAAAELLDIALRCDGVLLAGDLGKNSETNLALESFTTKYQGLLGISSDALGSLSDPFLALLGRPDTILELSFKQLRDLVIYLKMPEAVTSDLGKPKLAEILYKASLQLSAIIVIRAESQIWLAQEGKVIDCQPDSYQFAASIVWALQQPSKMLPAIASSTIP